MTLSIESLKPDGFSILSFFLTSGYEMISFVIACVVTVYNSYRNQISFIPDTQTYELHSKGALYSTRKLTVRLWVEYF